MRLINFGLGEILDRIAILSLKISYGTDAGMECAAFVRERDTLWAMVDGRARGVIFEHYCELAVVHARLWQGEDALRELRQRGAPHTIDETLTTSVVAVACAIQGWNDRRAALVAAINRAVGDDAVEKVVARGE